MRCQVEWKRNDRKIKAGVVRKAIGTDLYNHMRKQACKGRGARVFTHMGKRYMVMIKGYEKRYMGK